MGSPFGGQSPYLEGPQSGNSGRGSGRSTSFRTSSRNPSRGSAKGSTPRRTQEARYGSPDVDALLGNIEAGVAADFEAEAEAIRAQYAAQMGGGGGGRAAINEALAMLRDVQANRAAIKETYDDYKGLVAPLAEEALNAAKALVGEVTPEIEQFAKAQAEGIAADYAESDMAVAEEGARIGASEASVKSVQAEADEFEALYQAEAAAVAEDNLKLLELEGDVAETAAVAAQKTDEGEMKRRALLQDLRFQDMEEQAQAALASARRAAAAAASRRAALARARDAELANLQAGKLEAMQLNPHEAGEVAAISYLQDNATDIDYNRQQLVFNTVSNVISSQVPLASVDSYLRAQLPGVLTPKEAGYVKGSVSHYTQGMRHSQYVEQPQYSGRGSGQTTRTNRRTNSGRGAGGRTTRYS